MHLRNLVVTTLCVLISGCAYKGIVPYEPFAANSTVSVIPVNVYYKKNSSKLHPLQIAQGPTTYHIDVENAVDGRLVDMLKARFRNVVAIPSDADLIVEPNFIPTLKHLDPHGNAFIDAQLKLAFSDARTGAQLTTFETSSSISYSPPAFATTLQWVTAFSCLLLAPITVPVMVNSAGDKAVDMAEDTIAEMVVELDSNLMLRKRELIAYVSGKPDDAASSVQTTPCFPSKYDDILACVVVIRTNGGTGTGFFINNTGHIVTNEHVVRDEAQPSIRMRNGRSVVGRVVAIDKNMDIAIIETKLENTQWLSLGTQGDIEIGSEVMAIGTPLGLDWSISKGIVSAVRKNNDHMLVQTDASINPGNSGGPLISINSGKVIGVNSFVLKNHEQGVGGLGFAVSSHDVNRIVQKIQD
ncbi:MAG: S1C family serine protease [Kiritimatiellia bacterium]